MIRNAMLLLSTAAVLAVPSAADAKHKNHKKKRHHAVYVTRHAPVYTGAYYGRRAYASPYYGGYRSYGYSAGYGHPSYGYPPYGYGYPSGYSYGYSRPYGYGGYGYNGYQCGNPAAGAVVGGLAGAVIGSQVADNGRRHYYRRGGGSTTGALIGGAVGAVVGSAIAQGNC